MRYRLPVSTAPLVFFLTGGEQLRLSIGSAVGHPPLFRARRIRPPEALQREGSASQKSLVARGETQAGIGRR